MYGFFTKKKWYQQQRQQWYISKYKWTNKFDFKYNLKSLKTTTKDKKKRQFQYMKKIIYKEK